MLQESLNDAFSVRDGIRKKGWDYILMIDANLRGFFFFFLYVFLL